MAAEGAKIFRVMKTMILVIVMICAGLYSSAQEKKILDIPNSSPIIQSDTDNNKYIGLLMGHKADKVNALLRLVVFDYNVLKEFKKVENRTNMLMLVNKSSNMENIQRTRREVPDMISLFFPFFAICPP